MSYDAVAAAARGAEGERRVAEYLRSKGSIIVKRNYRDRFGEIDIIAEEKAYLVFVEVKTREAGSLVTGFEAVNAAKRERIRKTAVLFSRRIRNSLPIRFDVAEVTVSTDESGEHWGLRYLKNAF